MRDLVHHDSQLIVVDDVLPAQEFSSLHGEIVAGTYHSVHARRWDKSWRPWDGDPLRGEAVYFDPRNHFGWKGATYPTATSVDALVDHLRRLSHDHPKLVGVEGRDWVALFLAPWLYPVGSSLSPHRDAGPYSGSFTFFANKRWRPHWGGQLLVLRDTPSGSGLTDNGGRGSLIEEAYEAEGQSRLGVATCVFPQPNRLAVIGPNCDHMIARVDTNAGSRVRASIAGFFLRPR